MELAQGGSIADLIKERKDLVSRFDEDDIWRGARYLLLLLLLLYLYHTKQRLYHIRLNQHSE